MFARNCLNQNTHQHLNIIPPIIKVIFKDMVVFVFLSKTTSSIVKFIFKLICSLWLFVLPSIIRHIMWLQYMFLPSSESLNELAFERMVESLLSRYLILGDFNGHNHLWWAYQENERGKVVEHLIDNHNLILLNDCSYSVWYLPTNQLPTWSFFVSPFYIRGCCM